LDCGYDLHSVETVDKPVSMKAETCQFPEDAPPGRIET